MLSEKRCELLYQEYLVGSYSYRELGKRYGVSATTIHRILMKEKKKADGKVKETKLPEDLPVTMAELKALQEEVRMARLHIRLLEATIDIADEEYGTDLRKKAGTRRS